MGIQPWSERLPIQKNTGKVIEVDKSTPLQRTNIEITSAQKLPLKESVTQKNKIQTLSEKEDQCRFNLSFLAFNDLLIISELPLHEHKAMTPLQLRLLKSMRLSIGYPVGEPLQALVMNWPLVENNKIDQGEDAAVEAVQAQLKKQIEK